MSYNERVAFSSLLAYWKCSSSRWVEEIFYFSILILRLNHTMSLAQQGYSGARDVVPEATASPSANHIMIFHLRWCTLIIITPSEKETKIQMICTGFFTLPFFFWCFQKLILHCTTGLQGSEKKNECEKECQLTKIKRCRLSGGGGGKKYSIRT